METSNRFFFKIKVCSFKVADCILKLKSLKRNLSRSTSNGFSTLEKGFFNSDKRPVFLKRSKKVKMGQIESAASEKEKKTTTTNSILFLWCRSLSIDYVWSCCFAQSGHGSFPDLHENQKDVRCEEKKKVGYRERHLGKRQTLKKPKRWMQSVTI